MNKTLALLSVNDPRCRPFGKGSFVKSPIRVTMEVGGVEETTALNPLAFGARMIYCLDWLCTTLSKKAIVFLLKVKSWWNDLISWLPLAEGRAHETLCTCTHLCTVEEWQYDIGILIHFRLLNWTGFLSLCCNSHYLPYRQNIPWGVFV